MSPAGTLSLISLVRSLQLAHFTSSRSLILLRPSLATGGITDLELSALIDGSEGLTAYLVLLESIEHVESLVSKLQEETFVHVPDMVDLSQLDENSLKGQVVWIVEGGHGLAWPVNLRLDSHVLTYNSNGTKGDEIFLKETYRVKKGRVRQNFFGSWSHKGGLEGPTSSLWERRSDLSGVTLVNSVLEWESMFFFGDGGNGPYGFTVDVLEALRQRMGFGVEWVRPEDGQWGVSSDGGGTWTGIVGDLSSGRADLSTAGLSATRDRAAAADFGVGLAEDTVTLMSPFPGDHGGGRGFNWLAYLEIFTAAAWGSVLALAAAMGLLEALQGDLHQSKQHFPWNLTAGFVRGVVNCCLAFLQLSMDVPEGSLSRKALFVTLSLSFYFLFACYTGDLTASMTVGEPSSPLETFRDVARSGRTVVVLAGSVTEAFFTSEGSPAGAVRLASVHCPEDSMRCLTDEVLRLGPGHLSFDASGLVRDPRVLPLRGFRESQKDRMAFGFPRGSELRALMDFHLTKLQQGGIFRRLTLKWHGGGADPPAETGEEQSLGWDQLFFPALCVMVGTGVALALVATEAAAGMASLSSS